MNASAFVWLTVVGTLTVPVRGSAQQGGTRPSTAGAHGNADAITAAQLRTYLSFIASDETEGRATPSRGLDITARFIATHLARLGLRPAGGDGSWFQRIPLTRTRIDSSTTWAELGGRRFWFGHDF